MDKKQLAISNETSVDMQRTKRFLANYNDLRKDQTAYQAFDSLTSGENAQVTVGLPKVLEQIFNSKGVNNKPDAIQQIFDGIEYGIEEYQRRNGGENPPIEAIYAGMSMAVQGFTEHADDEVARKQFDKLLVIQSNAEKEFEAKGQFDKLSFDHHEALSVVPAAISVTIMTTIASSLPIVAQLPNPIGSNEVPLMFGRTTANIRMGVFHPGDYIDGDKAGLPYLENRHTLTMTKGAAGEFSLEVHVGYNAEKDVNGATKFVPDTSSIKAPFLGGRVVITVKGVPVAMDNNKNHPTKSGVSQLQQINGEAVEVDGKQYKIVSGTANLDTHTIDVKFDTANGNTDPAQDEVEAQVVFDYERKDSKGDYILTPPGLDMGFESYGIYASPMRAKVTATIDAITQMQNELGLNWNGAVLAVVQQKYCLEQTARLLRETRRACLMQAKHTQVIDLNKDGIQFSSVEGKLAAAKGSMFKARVSLTQQMNRPVGAVDYFVSDAGAIYFNSLDGDMYTGTGVSYGDNSSIYRIGTTNDGANVYYVPASLGVFDDSTNTGTTAEILALPRMGQPVFSPFIGMTAVPPIVLNANAELFEEQIGVYARISAERNPNPTFANQGILIRIINTPSL